MKKKIIKENFSLPELNSVLRYLLLNAFFFFSLPFLYGQNTDAMVIDEKGQVGIGLQMPQALLHLKNNSQHLYLMESSSPGGTWFTIGNSSSNPKNYFALIASGTDNTGGKGNLLITTGNSLNTVGNRSVLQISNNGSTKVFGDFSSTGTITAGKTLFGTKLGLGTTSPTATLQVTAPHEKYKNPVVIIQKENCGWACSQPGPTQALSLQNTNSTAGNTVGIGFADFNQDDNPTAWIGVSLNDKKNHTGNILFMNNDGEGNMYTTMMISNERRIGINTSTASLDKAILQINGSQNNQGGYTHCCGSQTVKDCCISLYSEFATVASAFYSFSDERIKDVKGRSNSLNDLSTLLRIKITDYNLKDSLRNGEKTQKKVIAQQVAEVFPEAVSQMKNEIPDIYKRATIEKGWVKLNTDLKAGERVKLITADQSGVYEILEVNPDGFKVKDSPEDGSLFVYGRQVDDFHLVDYDAIAMLNVSATQELHKQLEQQKNQIEMLMQQNLRLQNEFTELKKMMTQLQGQTTSSIELEQP